MMDDMNTLFTSEERRAGGLQVEGLEQLETSELAHLANLVAKLFSDPLRIKFGEWLLGEFTHEVERRNADGSIERGLMRVPSCELSDNQLQDVNFALCLMRDMSNFSQAERIFIGSLHRAVWVSATSRFQARATSGDRFVTREEVADLLGISDAQVTALVKRGVLPQPIRLSRSAIRWSLEEVVLAVRNKTETGN